jgi:hypothetical protein
MAVEATALLGTRGTGKSNGAKLIAEWLMDCSVPIVVFDPVGNWKHIKTAAPRPNGRGFNVVVAGGGPDADLPLTVASAGDIMRAALKGGVSIVFDLKCKQFTTEDWYKIVYAAAKVLFHENHQYGVRTCFVEEAGELCPQNTISKDQQALRSVLERTVRMGGNESLGLVLINQRAEEVSKAALGNCVNLFLHKQIDRNSLTAVDKWLKFVPGSKVEENIAKTMSTLLPGQCWVWTPQVSAQLVQMPECASYHPDRRKPVVSLPTKTVDVTKWVSKLKDTLATTEAAIAEQKKAVHDSDVQSQLRTEIQNLKRELHDLKSKAPPAPEQKEVPVLPLDAQNTLHALAVTFERWDATIEALLSEQKQVREELTSCRRMFESVKEKIRVAVAPPPSPRDVSQGSRAPTVRFGPPETKWKEARPTTNVAPSTSADGREIKFSKAVRSMCVALIQHGPMDAQQMGVTIGLVADSGHFNNMLYDARNGGWIVGERECLEVTDKGREAVGECPPLPTGQALIDYWRGKPKFPARAVDILQAIYDAGRPLSKMEIAEALGLKPDNGNFNNMIYACTARKLIVGPSDARELNPAFYK